MAGLAYGAKQWINADGNDPDSSQAQAQQIAMNNLKSLALNNLGTCAGQTAVGAASSISQAAVAVGVLGSMTVTTKIALAVGALMVVSAGVISSSVLLTRKPGFDLSRKLEITWTAGTAVCNTFRSKKCRLKIR